MNIDIGEIIKWENFNLQRHGGENKPRWFICIGSTGAFAQITAVYLCTTTTQLEKFQNSGCRNNHSHFVFDTNRFPMFEQDCVIDFNEKPYFIPLQKFKDHKDDIKIKGTLKHDTLRMIYKRIFNSGRLSFFEKCDIYDSYNRSGITGLKKPKRRKK